MDAGIVIEHILVSLFGAALYHVIVVLGKIRNGGFIYDPKKALRVVAAWGIQAGCCIGFFWIPADGMNYHDKILIGMGAAVGIDHGLKIVGWKIK